MHYWKGFKQDSWQEKIDVKNFIQANYSPYEGEAHFLAGPTDKTVGLWQECLALLAEETKAKGVLEVDCDRVSSITSHRPGYIDRDKEVIVGLQTDKPLKRSVIVNSGVRMAEQACAAYGYKLNDSISEIYNNHRITHNSAVFNLYYRGNAARPQSRHNYRLA